jgi:hypothetical protein
VEALALAQHRRFFFSSPIKRNGIFIIYATTKYKYCYALREKIGIFLEMQQHNGMNSSKSEDFLHG